MAADAGARMRADMAEQPEWLRGLADRREELAAALPDRLGANPAGRLWTLARGSSAHAAGMVAPWLGRTVGAPVPALRIDAVLGQPGVLPPPGSVVLVLSQSGRTPDVVDAAGRLREARCHVVAIVNERGPLVGASSHAVELDVGAERAIPATKTVLAQIAVLWLLGTLIAARNDTGARVGSAVAAPALLDAAGAAVGEALADIGPVDRAVQRLAAAPPVAATGRGVTSGLAAEWAHKVMETAGLPVYAASAPELAHGPIAIAGPGRAVVGFAVGAAAVGTVTDVLKRAEARGAETVLVAPEGEIAVPRDELPGLLAGLVRAQMLTERLAVALGRDPDTALGLSKVTSTS